MYLEDNVLSEISQTDKDTYYMISLMYGIQLQPPLAHQKKMIELVKAESHMMVDSDWQRGRGNGKMFVKEYKHSV